MLDGPCDFPIPALLIGVPQSWSTLARNLYGQQRLVYGRMARSPPSDTLRLLTFVPGRLEPATSRHIRRVGLNLVLAPYWWLNFVTELSGGSLCKVALMRFGTYSQFLILRFLDFAGHSERCLPPHIKNAK